MTHPWTSEQNTALREEALHAHDRASYYGITPAISLSPEDALAITGELERLRALCDDLSARTGADGGLTPGVSPA